MQILLSVTIFVLLISRFYVELLIDQPLLALNVTEHVFRLWQANEVWKHLRVLLVKLAELGEADLALSFPGVKPFQEFVDIVEDEVVLENAHHVRLLVIDQVIDHFHVFKFYVAIAVLAAKIGHDQLLTW